jgi:hypothetical protein
MANPYVTFKTNPEAETKTGVLLDYGDFRITIIRAGGANKKFSKLYTERTKPYKRQMDTETLDENVSKDLMIKLYADAVIIDMDVKDNENSTENKPVYIQGIFTPEGTILPYVRENVIKFFKDLPELFTDVVSQANLISLFRAEEQDAEIKNSQTPLIGA